VIVRNAAGAPVANATVSFAVESGGGTVIGSSLTTGADGVATVGGWILGPMEGEQGLVATSGALSPVRFVATATVPTRVVATQTLGSGTLAVTSGALAGTRLEIPAGAFPGPAAWTLEQRSSAGWPTRPGVHPVGATLRISRPDAGLAAAPMMLTMPAPVPPGTKPFVLIRDPASGGLHVLPTVNVEDGMITVAAMHFDPGHLAPPAPAGGGRGLRAVQAATGSGYDVEVVVSAIPVAQLEADQSSAFVPGIDDWDHFPVASAVEAPDRSFMPSGAVISALARSAVAGLPSLHGRFRQVPLVPATNRVAFHAGAYFGRIGGDEVAVAITTLRNATRAGMADQLAHDWLKAALLVTGLPQFAMASLGPGRWAPLIAWRAAAGQVHLADPWRPGNSGITVPFTGGTFGAFQVGDGLQSTVPAQWLSVAALMQWVNMRQVAADLAEWEAGRYPAGDRLRTPTRQAQLDSSVTVHAQGGFVEDTIIVLSHDTTRIWVECGACTRPLTASPLAAGGVAPFNLLVPQGGGSPNTFSGLGPEGLFLDQQPATDARGGLLMVEGNDADARWLGFRWLRLKKWLLDPRPPQSWSFGQPAPWTVLVEGPAPPPHELVWTFGPGAGVLTRVATGATEWITLSGAEIVGDSIPYAVEMRRLADGKLLARKEGKIPAPLRAVWRLTNVTHLSDPSCNSEPRRWTCESNFGSGLVTDWVIFAFPGADASVQNHPTPGVYLQESPPAVGTPVFPRPGARYRPLAHTLQDAARGVTGTMTWTGALESGAVSGSGTYTDRVNCNGIFIGSITATKTPSGLAGTITFSGNRYSVADPSCAGPPTGQVPPRVYSFTAELVP